MKIFVVDPHPKKDYGYVFGDTVEERIIDSGKATLLDIYTFFDENTSWIDKVVIENQFFGPNAKTTIDLAASRGKVEGLAELFEIPVDLVHPSTWKANVGLKGAKKNLQRAIRRRIKENTGIDDVDIQDAYMMFIYYSKLGGKNGSSK